MNNFKAILEEKEATILNVNSKREKVIKEVEEKQKTFEAEQSKLNIWSNILETYESLSKGYLQHKEKVGEALKKQEELINSTVLKNTSLERQVKEYASNIKAIEDLKEKIKKEGLETKTMEYTTKYAK